MSNPKQPAKASGMILIIIGLWACAGSRMPDGINVFYYPDGSLKAEVNYKR